MCVMFVCVCVCQCLCARVRSGFCQEREDPGLEDYAVISHICTVIPCSTADNEDSREEEEGEERT